MDPKCAQANRGTRVIQEFVAAAIDGSLANVFVHLQGTFPQTPVPTEPVVLDQRACVYRPRVIGARVGQTLQVKNSDDWLHNVHSLSAAGNDFNISEPKAGMVQSFKLKNEEVMLHIKCDVHSWMTTYVGVVTQPVLRGQQRGRQLRDRQRAGRVLHDPHVARAVRTADADGARARRRHDHGGFRVHGNRETAA